MSDYRLRAEDGDPILDLAAVCDLNEILCVRAINEDRAQREAERRARAKARRR